MFIRNVGDFQLTIKHYTPQDITLPTHRRDNLKRYIRNINLTEVNTEFLELLHKARRRVGRSQETVRNWLDYV
jgi:hypothetical protein